MPTIGQQRAITSRRRLRDLTGYCRISYQFGWLHTARAS